MRRLIYGFFMAIVLLGLYVRGSVYMNTLRSGQWTTAPALLELAYLLTIVALAALIGRKLLSRVPSKARLSGEVTSGTEDVAPESWVCRHCGEPSPRDCPSCVHCGRAQLAG